MTPAPAKWYRRLQVQLWLWAIFPLTLALVAVTFTSVYTHQRAMRDFVSERDTALAVQYVRQIEDELGHGVVRPDGEGLPLVMGDARIARRGVIYVLDLEGRVLFHPDKDLIGKQLPTSAALRQMALAAGTVNGQFPDGTATLASFATVNETGWKVVIEEPAADVIVPILRLSSVVPALLVLAIVLSLILIYFAYRTILRPLARLAESAGRITGGDFAGLGVGVGGVEEIRDLQSALRDMVERIRHYQASIRDYVEGITSSQEAERARLARELHDQTVQDLIAIGQRLQMAQRALDRGDVAGARDTLLNMRALCDATLEALRRLIRGLRPIYLEDLGFLPALETLAQEIQEGGTVTRVLVSGQPRRLQSEVEVSAFRVAQEALSNAVRHANARQIIVTVIFGGQELTLSVQDDGQGFTPPESPDELTGAGHFGLVGMQERARLLGGRLEVESRPGAGTRVVAHFPV